MEGGGGGGRWQSLAAELGQGLKVWRRYGGGGRGGRWQSLAAELGQGLKVCGMERGWGGAQRYTLKLFQPPLPLLLPPQPIQPLLAPKLTSLDISAQSNTLKLFQPQLKQLSKLTSLRSVGGAPF